MIIYRPKPSFQNLLRLPCHTLAPWHDAIAPPTRSSLPPRCSCGTRVNACQMDGKPPGSRGQGFRITVLVLLARLESVILGKQSSTTCTW